MFNYRDAKQEDFEIIASFPQNREEAYYMYPRGNYPFRPDELYEVALTRLKPTVLLFDEEIVGYGNMYDLREESCWIGNVIVKPSARGKGTGKQLIEVIMKRAKEELAVNEVNLICHNVNTKALHLYHELGFMPYDLKVMQGINEKDIMGILMQIKV